MVDCGLLIADRQYLRATIVSVCDNCARWRGRSARHGGCDFLRRLECNSRYSGSASAKKGAERTCSFSGCDHTR